jgi:hypothetical protein
MPVYKDESDEARSTFWRSLERAAAEVAQWPEWKRAYDLLPARSRNYPPAEDKERERNADK